jgi:PAS domain-containing protein
VNRALVELVGGKSAEDLLSRPIQDFIFPEDWTAVAARTARLETGATVEPQILRFRRLDAGWAW